MAQDDSVPPTRPAQKDAQIRAINAYLTGEPVADAYDAWAQSYESDLQEQGYVAPDNVAKAVKQYCDAPLARVLDIGCGTGLIGKRLTQFGFSNVDGIDISPQMLELARASGAYKQLITADLSKALPVKTKSYDLVVSSGTLETAHIGASALPELVRLARPGGLLCLSIDKRILTGFELGSLPIDILETRDVDIVLPRVPGDEAYPYQLHVWRKKTSPLDRLMRLFGA